MAIVAAARLTRLLSHRPLPLPPIGCAQLRLISHSKVLSDDPSEHGDAEPDPHSDSTPSDLVDASNAKPSPPANTRPYAEKLREMMIAKYLSNQPTFKPHRLYQKPLDNPDLQDLRVQYRKQLSDLRKEYAREVETKRAAKATYDKKQREEILRAKEERLRLKKEKSALRAIEVEADRKLLQEQLARETAERRSYRKKIDLKVEERRQRERDIIRQQSGTWIEEKDLEQKIIEALANPIDL